MVSRWPPRTHASQRRGCVGLWRVRCGTRHERWRPVLPRAELGVGRALGWGNCPTWWVDTGQTGTQSHNHTVTAAFTQPHSHTASHSHSHSHSHTATASTTYALVLFEMNTQQRALLWCESSLGQQRHGSVCGTGLGSCSFVGEPRADFGGGNAHEGRQASAGRHWRVPAAHYTHHRTMRQSHVCIQAHEPPCCALTGSWKTLPSTYPPPPA